MTTAIVTSEGQVTIPKEVWEELNLKAGDQVEFSIEGRQVVRMRARNLKAKDVYGIMGKGEKRDRPVSIEEMDEGIAEAVRADWERQQRDR